jgi:hypothetical protein
VRRLLAVVLLVVSAATAVRAQEHVTTSEGVTASLAPSPEGSASRILDRKFWVVAAGLNAAMVLDTKSTFDVARACQTCREANPLVAPFLRRGPIVTLAAGEAFDAGVMAIAAKMKASDRTWVRRTWWVVPAALGVGHTIAQRHNYNLLHESN